MDNFIDIPFTSKNLDRYFIRTAILKAIGSAKNNFKGKMLDIGCGKMPYRGYLLKNSPIVEYVGLDIESALEYDTSVKADFTWDGFHMPFKDAEFDTAFGTEVLEHCPVPSIILIETYRVLKPGSCFFFTVPFLWPLHEVPHDEFRYTPFSLQRLLAESGFEKINISATGGWHASMAQMLGLWLCRAPMGKFRRSVLSLLLRPLYKWLIKKDSFFMPDFKESQMITGLWGVAYKKYD